MLGGKKTQVLGGKKTQVLGGIVLSNYFVEGGKFHYTLFHLVSI